VVKQQGKGLEQNQKGACDRIGHTTALGRYSLVTSGLLLSLVTVFFRGLPSLMDCSSWSLACNGLPPFLPGLAPNTGGKDDGGGGGGGPERVTGGGGGGGGGNGMAICTRSGKTDKKQAVGSVVWDHYDGRTTIHRWDRRSEGTVWHGRTVRVMCWRHGGAHHQ